MPAERGPEDGLPRDAPMPWMEEGDAVRYELPVIVQGKKGLLVIRIFGWKDDPEISIRGHAVEWMRRRWWR